jgi:hypothetical protein
MAGSIQKDGDHKLRDLSKLVWTFEIALSVGAVLVLVFAVVLAIKFNVQSEKANLALYGAIFAGVVALFGNFISKYMDFKRQYIELKYTYAANSEMTWKRLVAFHAEISENLRTLVYTNSKDNREKLLQAILKYPSRDRFTRADTSNPIYEENRPHLHLYDSTIIRAVTAYYHLDQDLNLALGAFLLPEFKSLLAVQKLKWTYYLFALSDKTVNAGRQACDLLFTEITRTNVSLEHKNFPRPYNIQWPDEAKTEEPILVWNAVSDDEIKPLLDLITKLDNAQKRTKTKLKR